MPDLSPATHVLQMFVQTLIPQKQAANYMEVESEEWRAQQDIQLQGF